jgi:hypothetical protein
VTDSDLQLLRQSIDKELLIESNDGETRHIKLILVGEEEQDVIVDLVPPKDHAVRSLWSEIRAVHRLTNNR